MAQKIVVNESIDSITVIDKDTGVPVSLNQESVAVSSGPDALQVVMQDDNTLLIEDNEESLTIEDKLEQIKPKFQEVLKIIQIQQITVPSEEEMPYVEEIDFVTEDLIYRGWADPGSLTSAPVWRIRRTQFVGTDDDVRNDWADGNANFDNVWNNRNSLSYS